MKQASLRRNGKRTGVFARKLFSVFAASLVVAAAAGAGYWYGRAGAPQGIPPSATLAELEQLFEQERLALEEAGQESQAQLDAFAGRVGAMQAEILRLNALGERLVVMAELDADEFDFENPPPVGGPEEVGAGWDTSLDELMGEMTDMQGLISDRKRKLKELEQSIMEKDLKEHATPSGWPVRSGYISSKYGYRKHPTRKRAHFHSGVDFASKRGAPVVVTADGIVIYSGWRSGYGRLIEVRHMDGLVTRYAHNQKNLVKEGEMVEKGQTIARLGSSGRATGPHVHFEVRKDGKAIDPLKYVGVQPPKTNS